MADSIVVLNAGSSSFKFSLFTQTADGVSVARGQAEGLYTSPRFIAKDAAGAVLEEKSWGDGIALGHAGALDHMVSALRTPGRASTDRRWPSGSARRARLYETRAHRRAGCHNAAEVRTACHCINRTTWYRSVHCSSGCHRFHKCGLLRCRVSPQPAAGRTSVRAAEADYRTWSDPLRLSACRMNTSRLCCPRSTRASLRAKLSCCIWATAPACARSPAGAAWLRWDSPRPTVCRWERAAATSIPASCCI